MVFPSLMRDSCGIAESGEIEFQPGQNEAIVQPKQEKKIEITDREEDSFLGTISPHRVSKEKIVSPRRCSSQRARIG